MISSPAGAHDGSKGSAADIDILVSSFARHQWNKARSTFEGYLHDQQAGTRQTWIAIFKDELAGYVTLNWRSSIPDGRTDLSTTASQ